MKEFNTSLKERLSSFDPLLLIFTSLLSILSLLTIYGIRDASGVSMGNFFMQLAASAVGSVLALAISTVDYEVIVRRLWVPVAVAEIAVLTLTLVFGTAEGANKSWLFLGGFGIQPSEFAKLSFIITFAKHLDLVGNRINRPLPLLTLVLHAGLVIGLILLSGDLGVALVFVGITAIMLFGAGLNLFYFLGAAAAAVIAFPYIWPHLREDQQLRIIYGFNPEGDPLGKGMQPLLGRECIARGGLFGNGLNGGSVYKRLYACENDFAFSSLCEKFGVLCGILTIGLLAALIVRVLYVGFKSRKKTGSLICIGIAGMLMLQTAENVGMCLARLPVIGITLPFISYGGSSVTSVYLMIGFVHSIWAHRVKYFHEREER
ncbi:MAG: FtsW/RodA/SpoVE family cell cycle protein [Clostridia bacterium]|nr:FtsW/RodA/SpoVE family cell cycle protein [Clostridia bacterium]